MIVRVGGLGSEFPPASMTVREVMKVPGTSKMTLPGACAMEVVGEPPGKIHEYFAAVVLVLKTTEPPAGMVTSEAGDVIAPDGGEVLWPKAV